MNTIFVYVSCEKPGNVEIPRSPQCEAQYWIYWDWPGGSTERVAATLFETPKL